MLLICAIAFAMLTNNLARAAPALLALKASAVVPSVVAVLMFVFFGCIAYRNVFFRDEIVLLKDGAAAPAAMTSVYVSDIIAVRLKAPPSPFSAEGKREFMGFDNGSIMIVTSTELLHFGAGLGAADAEEMARRIEVFRNS